MPILFFAFALQALAAQVNEPQFTLGNVITIVVVIITGVAAFFAVRGKVDAMSDALKEHIEDDRRQFAILAAHVTDDDKHIGRRLYEELMRRFDQADENRDRLEKKIDTVIANCPVKTK